MDDLISRQAAIQTALEFIVEYLGGAFDENLQKKMIERMNVLPSAQPEPAIPIAWIAYRNVAERERPYPLAPYNKDAIIPTPQKCTE